MVEEAVEARLDCTSGDGSGRRFVSPAEAAAELGVSRSTVLRAIKSGRLRSVQLGSRRLVDLDSLSGPGRDLTGTDSP